MEANVKVFGKTVLKSHICTSNHHLGVLQYTFSTFLLRSTRWEDTVYVYLLLCSSVFGLAQMF